MSKILGLSGQLSQVLTFRQQPLIGQMAERLCVWLARNATMEDVDLEKVKAYLVRRSENNHHTSRLKDIERVLIGMECAVSSKTYEDKHKMSVTTRV